MGLSAEQIQGLKRLAVEEGGTEARLRLFGSRLDDTRSGGDVDLLLELALPATNPVASLARAGSHVG